MTADRNGKKRSHGKFSTEIFNSMDLRIRYILSLSDEIRDSEMQSRIYLRIV